MKITHVVIFQGEVPETVLCTSLDEAKTRFFEAFKFDDEDKEYFEKELTNEDRWTFAESGEKFRFNIGVGEIEEVDIFVVSKPQSDWLDMSSAPKDGTTFLAYGEALIDPDFNPEGVSLCAWQDDAGWAGSVWDGQFDLWQCKSIEPTHWKAIDTPIC